MKIFLVISIFLLLVTNTYAFTDEELFNDVKTKINQSYEFTAGLQFQQLLKQAVTCEQDRRYWMIRLMRECNITHNFDSLAFFSGRMTKTFGAGWLIFRQHQLNIR